MAVEGEALNLSNVPAGQVQGFRDGGVWESGEGRKSQTPVCMARSQPSTGGGGVQPATRPWRTLV